MKNRNLVMVLVFVIMFFRFVDCDAQSRSEGTILKDFFSANPHPTEELVSAKESMPKVCLEAGDKAIPILSEAVKNVTASNVGQADIAVNCLVRIGGPEVVRFFRKMYDESADETYRDVMRAILCKAMQSTGSGEDINFLMDSLSGSAWGGVKGLAPRAAAYSLAVLKPEIAKTALKNRSKELTVPSEEVKFTLERVNGREWHTPQAVSAKGPDAVILTVFRFGIPNISMSDAFVELKAKRIWKRTADTWRYEPLIDYDKYHHFISFDVFVTKDGKRAMCSVGLFCGNTCGYGYDYVLKYDGEGWRVVGLFPTWIS